jgi:class 3 adenylate cyclase
MAGNSEITTDANDSEEPQESGTQRLGAAAAASAAVDTGKLEVAHILFMDIVGYARLPMEQQARVVNDLQSLVQDTADFRQSNPRGELLCLPRGDGMALVFFRDALAPLRCAMEIARELKTRTHVQLRMGLNTGPVYVVEDINGDRDVSGLGIIEAQRVMDRGDAGHILLSASVADHVNKLTAWRPYVHDLNMLTVKHGQRIHVYNFYTQEVGNSEHPRSQLAEYAAVVERMRAPKPKQRVSRLADFRDSFVILGWLVFVVGGMGWGLWTISPTFRDAIHSLFQRSRSESTGGKPTQGAGSPTFSPNVTGTGGTTVSIPSDNGGRQRQDGQAKKPGEFNLDDKKHGNEGSSGQKSAPSGPPGVHVAMAAGEGEIREAGSPDSNGEPAQEVISDTHNVEVTIRVPASGSEVREVELWYRDDHNGGEAGKTWTAAPGDVLTWGEEIYGKNLSLRIKFDGKEVFGRKYRIY